MVRSGPIRCDVHRARRYAVTPIDFTGRQAAQNERECQLALALQIYHARQKAICRCASVRSWASILCRLRFQAPNLAAP
jgi:hypothetical protein